VLESLDVSSNLLISATLDPLCLLLKLSCESTLGLLTSLRVYPSSLLVYPSGSCVLESLDVSSNFFTPFVYSPHPSHMLLSQRPSSLHK